MQLFASVSKPESSVRSVMIKWSQPTDTTKYIYGIAGVRTETNSEIGAYEDDVKINPSTGFNIFVWHPNGSFSTHKVYTSCANTTEETTIKGYLTAITTNSYVLVFPKSMTISGNLKNVLKWWASNSTNSSNLEADDGYLVIAKRGSGVSVEKRIRNYNKNIGIVSGGMAISGVRARQAITVSIEYKINTGSWVALASGLIEKQYLHNTSSLSGNITYRLRAYDGIDYSGWVETAQTALPT